MHAGKVASSGGNLQHCSQSKLDPSIFFSREWVHYRTTMHASAHPSTPNRQVGTFPSPPPNENLRHSKKIAPERNCYPGLQKPIKTRTFPPRGKLQLSFKEMLFFFFAELCHHRNYLGGGNFSKTS